MSLRSEVIEQVRLLEPDSATRWPTATLNSVVHWADCLIKEEAPLWCSHENISLVADTTYYDLDEKAVQVVGVDWLQDGSSIDGPLSPTTTRELDCKSLSWRDEAGSEPEAYFLYSTPGIKDQAQIGIYPRLSSVDSEKIRVYIQACVASPGDSELTPLADDLALRDVYAPLVLAILLPPMDEKMAAYYFGQYRKNVERLRQRYANEYPSLGEYASMPGVLR